jgi:hypothetical protein
MYFKRFLLAMLKALVAFIWAPFDIGAEILKILWNLLCYPIAHSPEKHKKRVLEHSRLLLDAFINPPLLFLRGLCEFIADAILPGAQSYVRRKK